MAKRSIRYKLPDWSSWNYIEVEEKEVEEKVAALIALGYEVEA